jgi:putative ABC transport system substrate-binding protein
MGAGLSILGGCQFMGRPATLTPTTMRRIGYLYPGTREFNQPYAAAFADQLRQLGWVDGDNLAIEWRYAEGHDELLLALAADLVHIPVDLLVAATASGFEDQLNSGVPIIGIAIGDPLRLGSAKSLARPGGNYTGTTSGGVTFNVKSMEMLKAVLPQLSRLVILGDPSYTPQRVFLQSRAETARALGIHLLNVDVQGVDDLDGAFATAMGWSAEALLLLTQPSFTSGVNTRVVDLAARHRLPAMYQFGPVVTENNGLMAYTADILGLYRQSAEYVDKVLHGTSPAELPIEEPRGWDFIVNIKAAQDLGLAFPPDAAAQVTQWVQ